MTLRMPKIDPESFRGRLYLLAIDKVVIGALIAMALFVYDRWRTTEARRYDEARQETDLGFKRTEYVKELVPIVLDDRSNVLFRAHAFAALVETKAVSADGAVSLMQRLLLADVLGADNVSMTSVNPVNDEVHIFTLSADTDDDFLLATMLKVMPAGLAAMLKEYEHTTVQHREVRATPASDRNLKKAAY